MNKTLVDDYTLLYKNSLLNDVIPFWEKYSVDWQHGGYFTCLDKKGNVYDTDKFCWLQARQIWTFSMLYNRVEEKSSWLEIAANGIQFLKKYGCDNEGSFYFSFTKEGKPLTKAFNIYSDCFAAVAFAEYAKATGDEESLDIAKKTYSRFLLRQNNPKGIYEKGTDARQMKSFGLPMMTAWLTNEMEGIVQDEKQTDIFDNCIYRIFDQHYNPKTNIIHEHVHVNGGFVDTYDGRLINPGHGIEAMWFLMDIGLKRNDTDLIAKASQTCIEILDYSWDKEYGGIFYFMDAKGAPLQQLEWDQKLWWVHLETLIALSRAYLLTESQEIWEWYLRVHEYTWSHFPDPENGEWLGYLNRQGIPLLDLKGGKWKGCFHVPRALYECWQNFAQIEDKQL